MIFVKKSFWKPFLAVCLVGALCLPALGAVKWKMAHYMPVDSMIDDIAKNIIAEVEEKSKGEIKFDLVPAQQLGSWEEMSQQIMRGAIQVGIMPVSAVYNQALQIRVLPYCVMNWKQAREAFIGENPYLFNILAKEMDKSRLKALAVVAEGFGGMGFSRVPSFDPCDPDSGKNGFKARVPGGNIAFESMAQEFGYIPTSVAWGEIYMALQTGLVDCQMGGQPYSTQSQFIDVTKAWVQLNTHFQHSFVYVNKKAWEKLSPELKEILQTAARKYADTSFERAEKEDAMYMQKMADAGVKIYVPTDDQYAKLAAKIRAKTWPKLEGIVGKATIDNLLAVLNSVK